MRLTASSPGEVGGDYRSLEGAVIEPEDRMEVVARAGQGRDRRWGCQGREKGREKRREREGS